MIEFRYECDSRGHRTKGPYLDEVIAKDEHVHLEMMDYDAAWMGIGHDSDGCNRASLWIRVRYPRWYAWLLEQLEHYFGIELPWFRLTVFDENWTDERTGGGKLPWGWG